MWWEDQLSCYQEKSRQFWALPWMFHPDLAYREPIRCVRGHLVLSDEDSPHVLHEWPPTWLPHLEWHHRFYRWIGLVVRSV